MPQKIFSDKTVPNFESQEVGPKWHFLSTILQIFTGKMFFKFSLNLAGKNLKIEGISEKLIACSLS